MGLVLRKNLNRPLTAAEVDGNFTFLNIDRWKQMGYLKGQFVYHADALTGDNILFTCLVDHDSSVYSTGFVTAGVVNGTYQTIWLQIASSGGSSNIRTITGTTLMGVGVAAPVYAGITGVTHGFRRVQSMNSNITVSYDDGTVYLNASGSTSPTPVDVYTTSTPASCYGVADGTLTIHATGGTGNRRYSIDNGTTWYPSVGFTSDTTHIFTGLLAGTYTGSIKVQDEVLGLVGTPTGVVGGTIYPLHVEATTTPVTVTGYTDGTLTLSVSGGNGSPYYVEVYDQYMTPIGSGDNEFYFNNLTNDVQYFYYVYDSNTSCGYVNGNVTLSATKNRIKLLDVQSTQPQCYNGVGSGTITLVNGRGSGSFNYRLDNNAWSSATTLYSKTFSNLTVGSHILYAKDVLTNEIVSGTTTVTNSLSSPISGFTISSNSICSSTAATVLLKVKNVSAGTTPQYQDNSTTGSWTNLTAGTGTNAGYYLVQLNKTATSSGTLYYRDPTCGVVSGSTYSVIKTNAITVVQSGTATAPTCPGDNWTYYFTLSGGDGTYSYSLNNSTWYSYTNGSALTVPSSGVYGSTTKTVYFKDSLGCTPLTQPSVSNWGIFVITGDTVGSPTAATCYGGNGSFQFSVRSGSGNGNGTNQFTYKLINVGNNTTGSTITLGVNQYGPITVTPTSGSGTYNVAINRSGSSCTPSVKLASNVVITQPTQFNFSGSTTYRVTNPVTCSGTGTIKIYLTGGTTPYKYRFGTSGSFTNATPTSGYITISSVNPGTYTIQLQDSSSCPTTPLQLTGVPVVGASSPTLTLGAYSAPSCSTGNAHITLTGTGGSGDYSFGTSAGSYPYGTGGTTYSLDVIPFTSRTYYIKDNVSFCTGSAILTGYGAPSAISITTATATAETTVGAKDGKITVVHNGGGTSPWTVTVTNTAVSTGVTTSAYSSTTIDTGTILPPGTYTVIVRDNNGCTSSSVTRTVTAASSAKYMYYFKYNASGTSPNIYQAGTDISNLTISQLYYNSTAGYASTSFEVVLKKYKDNASTLFGGGSINLTALGLSTTWPAFSSAITFTFPPLAVGFNGYLGLLVPTSFPILSSGTYLYYTTTNSGLPNAVYLSSGTGGTPTAITIDGETYYFYRISGTLQSMSASGLTYSIYQ